MRYHNRSDVFIIRVYIFGSDIFITFTQKDLKYQMITAHSIFIEIDRENH
jgi:hypothetical protein